MESTIESMYCTAVTSWRVCARKALSTRLDRYVIDDVLI